MHLALEVAVHAAALLLAHLRKADRELAVGLVDRAADAARGQPRDVHLADDLPVGRDGFDVHDRREEHAGALLVLADHLLDVVGRRGRLRHRAAAAAAGSIVTFGIVPSRPDTGFGYLEVGPPDGGVAPLARFVEKPDHATAEQYVGAGYLWNSGMFVFTAGVILEELRRFAPALEEAAAAAVAGAERRGSTVWLGDRFLEAPSVSIDHAVMEKTSRGGVVPLDVGWSDVGSWQALWEVTAPGGETVAEGPVLALDVERSYLRAESKPVAVIGLADVVVVETPEAVLVMDRRRAQDVREAAEWFSSRQPED